MQADGDANVHAQSGGALRDFRRLINRSFAKANTVVSIRQRRARKRTKLAAPLSFQATL
jgi:hypothetical protein